MDIIGLILLLFTLVSLTKVSQNETTDYITTTTTTTTTIRTTTVPVSCFNPYCKCTAQELVCKDFNSYSQLTFSISNSTYERIVLIPTGQLELNDYLDLSNIRVTPHATLQLWNIKNFAIDSTSPFGRLMFSTTGSRSLIAELVKSSFRFSFQKVSVTSICSSEMNPNATISPLFVNIRTIVWVDTEIAEPICPYIFRNVTFQTFKWKDLNPNSRIVFANTTQVSKNYPHLRF